MLRNRSPIYQQKLDMIYQRLSPEMKCLISASEKKLRDNIYCWSLDPEDSFTEDDEKRINRDATARIYAFGEVTSTHTEMCERVASWKKEGALSNDEGGTEDIENTILQAPPFRTG